MLQQPWRCATPGHLSQRPSAQPQLGWLFKGLWAK